MKFYFPEPVVNEQKDSVGVLLINLGSPDDPNKAAVKTFLGEFLADRRVVELPRWRWLPILKLIILNTRPKKSAKNYQLVWSKDGSPLIHYSHQLAKAINSKLNIPVEVGMTYGNPSLKSALKNLKARGINRIICLPLFPQYASCSTGAALDQLWRVLIKTRNQPQITTINDFHNHPDYIEAMATQIETHWQNNNRGDKIIFSFHGIPVDGHLAGDPYVKQCKESVRLLAQRLKLNQDQFMLTFQSRFGNSVWVDPCTQDVLVQLPKDGVKNIDIFCPGFVSDCLETLEEVAISCKELFLSAGGENYQYIPCLNNNEIWLDGLANIIKAQLK